MKAMAKGGWAALAAMTLAACGGPQTPPPEPLVADPPAGSEEGAATGAASSELQRGIAYVKNGKFEEAKPHLEKALELTPDSAEAAAYLGLAKEQTGDRPGAEAAYKRALASDPKHRDAAVQLAALYLDNPPRPDEAIAVLSGAVDKVADPAPLHQNLAYAYSLKKDVANASKHYDAAIAKGANGADVHLAYGAMLLAAKQIDKAAAELKKALAGAGDDAQLLAEIGVMLGPAKAYGDCIKAFDRAIKLKSDLPEYYVRRGTCRHELNDEEGARADFQAAIKADAKFAPAHYYLGMSYLAENKRTAAIAALEQAAKHGGDTELGKRAREKLKELSKQK